MKKTSFSRRLPLPRMESQRRGMGTLPALLQVHEDIRDLRHEHRTFHKGRNTLWHWCYSLRVFLVIIHVVLVAMLFGDPEYRVTVPADSTIIT
ncbi:hypothetical protein BDN67DRAFT_3851 [Paxillus ammoniavirescens]|nr:hypothetical protein BDN67DRAFT_3851 [Paxillus ammoniavirescens]